MNYCGSCGLSIPEGQKFCSMCVGDISYGADGYYEEWAKEQEEYYREEQAQEQRQEKD